jgi:multidrug efflux pump
MILSDLSIRRPVICIVTCLIICIVGVLRFNSLPVREYPEVDAPAVTINTSYPGASAQVVETKITEPLEKEIAAVEGVVLMRSTSSEQFSNISIEFDLSRDIDEAANDVRDRVSRVRLPSEVDTPRVTKTDPDSTPVLTMSFNSDLYSRLDIAEMLERIVVPRIQVVPGVGAIRVDGPRYAMRLWLDNDRLAAYRLTVTEVEAALRRQNVDVPSGRIESASREFPVRLMGNLVEVSEFENLVLATRGTYQVKFSDVGRVELGREDYRETTRFNGRPTVGLQILRAPQTNLLEMAAAIKALMPTFKAELPEGINIQVSKDDSVYVERSVQAVYRALIEAAVLVVLMIFLFLRDWRATFIPIMAIPVSIIGSIAIISALGFSINVLTLLACVLAIGLVVDDAIVMLENIYRRIEAGETPLQASLQGARQVAFAIIATMLTLAAVFTPVALQSGQAGALFYEFGITLTVTVFVSAFVALTLTPMLCSRMLKGGGADGRVKHGWLYDKTEPFFVFINDRFARMLRASLRFRSAVLVLALGFAGGSFYLFTLIPSELIPQEDRGVITANLTAPVGSTFEYQDLYAQDMDALVRAVPEMDRAFQRVGRGRPYTTGTLRPWEDRTRTTQEVISELRRKMQQNITGAQVTVSLSRPFGQAGGGRGVSAIQMVLQGSDFNQLQISGNEIMTALRETGSFSQPRLTPSPTKPQLDVRIDRARAADLRVSVSDVAATLETMLGSRRVTNFQRGDQQYYVILQVEDSRRVTPADLARLYVRSANGNLIQLSNLVTWSENTVPENYPHFNRLRSVTLSAQLADGVTIGQGIEILSAIAREKLPAGYGFAWDGESRQFLDGASDTNALFGLALLFTFLILAAQFESWIHPLTIFSGVVLALAGGVLVLYCTRFWSYPMTDNLFSRFGLIMLIGLVAKNGILIVEFANQLQVEKGMNAAQAAFESATIRFRPILMTSIATVLGAFPIAFSGGAGAEVRNPLGIVIVGGLSISTILTLFVVPILYVMMDTLCIRLTGRNSAHGLKRAGEIARESERGRVQGHGEPVLAK